MLGNDTSAPLSTLAAQAALAVQLHEMATVRLSTPLTAEFSTDNLVPR